MAIRILSFDPMNQTEIEAFEKNLDFYLGDGWVVLTTISGNRAGIDGNARAFRSSRVMSPNYKDYIVFVLRHSESSQSEMENAEVVKRSQ